MTDITAKVKCTKMTQWGTDEATFTFDADYQDGRNKAWAKYTPSLTVNITVKDNAMFQIGKPYTLTFTLNEELAEVAA